MVDSSKIIHMEAYKARAPRHTRQQLRTEPGEEQAVPLAGCRGALSAPQTEDHGERGHGRSLEIAVHSTAAQDILT